jgi:hypothetical protein
VLAVVLPCFGLRHVRMARMACDMLRRHALEGLKQDHHADVRLPNHCKSCENKSLIIYELHARKARLQHPMDISVQAKSKTPHISAYFNTIISNIRTIISIAMVIQLPFPLLFLATLPSLVLARSSVL